MNDRNRTLEANDAVAPADLESRWPVAAALFVAGAVYSALPDELSLGPRWLLMSLLVCLTAFGLITHWRQNHRANAVVGYVTDGIVTLFLIVSVAMLLRSLPRREVSPAALLRAAAALWICNVVLFSLWYWRLDAGGPYARHGRGEHAQGAFLFPPMTADGKLAAGKAWRPRYIDYLFLSFNTSTALSPTDAPVISRWAKALVMVQALISLSIVIVLAARAVNLL